MVNNKNSSASSLQKTNPNGLGVLALAAIVVSSMIGGGIYSLPQNMAAGASAGAVLLAWVITGIGIYFIANTFSILSMAKPDLTTGIYMYSREGFGPFAGFTIGWSYWLCQVCGNVGYAVITMDALNLSSQRYQTSNHCQHHWYNRENRTFGFVHSDFIVCF